MKRPLFWWALIGAMLLQGCILSVAMMGDSRLQLENGSRSAITDLEVVGEGGTTRLLVGDTLFPGERSRMRDIGLNGRFTLRLVVGDSACIGSGCGVPIDLGKMELGGSMRFRFISDRDGARLEER